MRDPDGLAHSNLFRDAVDCTRLRNDRVAVVANYGVSRHRFSINLHCSHIKGEAIDGNKHCSIDDNGIGVGVIVGVWWILTRAAWRHGDADNAIRPTVAVLQSAEVGNSVLYYRVVRDIHRVLADEERFLVQQFHVHVDMVNAIVKQRRHLDETMETAIPRKDRVDRGFCEMRVLVDNET